MSITILSSHEHINKIMEVKRLLCCRAPSCAVRQHPLAAFSQWELGAARPDSCSCKTDEVPLWLKNSRVIARCNTMSCVSTEPQTQTEIIVSIQRRRRRTEQLIWLIFVLLSWRNTLFLFKHSNDYSFDVGVNVQTSFKIIVIVVFAIIVQR